MPWSSSPCRTGTRRRGRGRPQRRLRARRAVGASGRAPRRPRELRRPGPDDPHLSPLGLLEVLLDREGRVDDDGGCAVRIADEIRRASEGVIDELREDHEWSLREVRCPFAGENRAGLGRREAAYQKVCGRLRTTACDVFAAARRGGVLPGATTRCPTRPEKYGESA